VHGEAGGADQLDQAVVVVDHAVAVVVIEHIGRVVILENIDRLAARVVLLGDVARGLIEAGELLQVGVVDEQPRRGRKCAGTYDGAYQILMAAASSGFCSSSLCFGALLRCTRRTGIRFAKPPLMIEYWN